VALDPSKFRITKPLIAEASNENPFQRTRSSFEFRQSVLVGIVLLLFATNGRLDLVAIVDDRLQYVNKIPWLSQIEYPRSGMSSRSRWQSHRIRVVSVTFARLPT